jgi:hypothetical protein
MTLAMTQTMTRMNTRQNPSLTTPRGRKQKPLTIEEWKELYEWHIYILYRRAVDY